MAFFSFVAFQEKPHLIASYLSFNEVYLQDRAQQSASYILLFPWTFDIYNQKLK